MKRSALTRWLVLGVLCWYPAGLAWADPAPSPAQDLKPIEELSLADLLDLDVASGEKGSFGYRLERFDTEVFLHSYLTLDFLSQGEIQTFDVHYFNLFVGTNVRDVLYPELQLEIEHLSEIGVRFAQLDAKLHSALILRAGLFLVPFGLYNEFLYPEFISKLPRGPLSLMHGEVIPAAWNDVGIQLRGAVSPFSRGHLNYAIYLTNGLEQKDPLPDDGVIVEGGSLRGMRGNYLDSRHANKAFGGRIGLDLFGEAVSFGISGYRGKYTAEGSRNLTMVGADALLSYQRFYLLAEVAHVNEEVTDPSQPDGVGAIDKKGIYLVGAYAVTDWLTPAVGFDRAYLGPRGGKTRTTVCLNWFPLKGVPFVVRASYTFSRPDGVDVPRDDLFMAQTSLGF